MEKDVKEKVESAKETAAKVSDAAKETAAKVSDTAKEKAKQAQEYLQSEEFQNKKNEAVKNTKSAANNFFRCTINNDEDYARAEKRRKNCIYAIIAAAAATIILFPFYDKHFWLDGGLIKLILHILSVLSVISKVLVVPVSIILLVRYFFANKAVKEYSTANPNVQPDKLNTKRAISVLVASVILCVVFTPVLNKIDNDAYNKYMNSSSADGSGGLSTLVESSEGESGLQFKITADEYIKKYNKKTKGMQLSKDNAKSQDNSEVISYLWSLEQNKQIMIVAYKKSNKIRDIRYYCPTADFNSKPAPFIEDMSVVFGIIDGTLNKSSMEDILIDAGKNGGYYDGGIRYTASGSGDTYVVLMQAVKK